MIELRQGAKVSRNVFKICKKYLTHIQKSVFEGELTPAKLQKLHNELSQYLRADLDSVVVFKSKQKKGLDKEFWAADESEKTSNFF